jgi:hypothetical protein
MFTPWTCLTCVSIQIWHHQPHDVIMRNSFINNNKNEQPRESLHMIMLIFFFYSNKIPSKHVSTRQFKVHWIWINEFALTKTYSWNELDNANYLIQIWCAIKKKKLCVNAISVLDSNWMWIQFELNASVNTALDR